MSTEILHQESEVAQSSPVTTPALDAVIEAGKNKIMEAAELPTAEEAMTQYENGTLDPSQLISLDMDEDGRIVKAGKKATFMTGVRLKDNKVGVLFRNADGSDSKVRNAVRKLARVELHDGEKANTKKLSIVEDLGNELRVDILKATDRGAVTVAKAA